MAITWANILEWKTGPLDEIAQTLFEASQGLREAYEKGQDHLNALQSEGEAVTAMRATTITNLASLERALTNVNGALMARSDKSWSKSTKSRLSHPRTNAPSTKMAA